MARGYSWKVLISHTFLRRVLERSDVESVRFGVSDYARILQEGLSGKYTPGPSLVLLVFAITLIAVLVTRKEAHPRRRALLFLLLLVWGTIVVHFLAFPMLADRFFVAQYLTCIAACVELLRHRLSAFALRHGEAGA
jgi:uncharacterized membrane protein